VESNADLRYAKDSIDILYVPFHIGSKVLRGLDLTRFQRAGKRSEESAGHGSNHVIESGRILFFHLEPVLGGVKMPDPAVHAIVNGLGEAFEQGRPVRPLVFSEARSARVDKLSHGELLDGPESSLFALPGQQNKP